MDEDQLPAHLRAPFPTLGRRAVAVSDHPQASQAACDIVQSGGNAVDASVAMSFVLGCCCPYYAGIGGGGFALVWLPDWSEPRWLDFREVAPAAAHPEFFESLPTNAAYQGKHSVGVPGNVAGLYELHSRYGRLPWSEVLAPAVACARQGVRVDSNWYRISLTKEAAMAEWPEASRIFLRDGRSPFPGTCLTFEDLAQTYTKLAELGPDYFYRGELAARIVSSLDGWMTAADLENYRVRWRTPLQMGWGSGRVYTVSAPSAGGLQLLQILGLMQRLGSAHMGPPRIPEVDFYHWLTESMRISFRERIHCAGDPDFRAPDPVHFLNSEWFDHWLPQISDSSALSLSAPALAYSEGGTASHAVASHDGGGVIMTESVNQWFGSLVVPPGTGVLLNDIMDDFSTGPHKPDQFSLPPSPWNQVEAGKRPASSSAPAIWMENGRPRLLVGSAGGPRITTSVAQILLNLSWNGENVQQAVSRARIHHQWHPDVLEVEPQVPLALREALAGRGHRVMERNCRSHAAALECHWDEGFFSGGNDFRSFGAARGL